ncbi:phage polarity suppression protein [Escherichia coli]|nr:phage polarity suppression protein [Escherichia coli]
MTARGTPDQALTSFRNARILWAGHSESRKAVEQQITSLLAATEKPADYARQLELLRERLDVLKWQINCAARECIYAQHLLMEACTEAALSNFMQANGAALTSALAPFLKGRGGVDVASRILRSALVRQLAITPPEIAGDYRELLDESGLMPDPGMIRDCQGSYTPAQHLRFQQRLNDINDIQE